jgi:hypothetical protein
MGMIAATQHGAVTCMSLISGYSVQVPIDDQPRRTPLLPTWLAASRGFLLSPGRSTARVPISLAQPWLLGCIHPRRWTGPASCNYFGRWWRRYGAGLTLICTITRAVLDGALAAAAAPLTRRCASVVFRRPPFPSKLVSSSVSPHPKPEPGRGPCVLLVRVVWGASLRLCVVCRIGNVFLYL